MGFSFASVVLSYFLIAGGTFFTMLLALRLGLHSEYLGYIILAAGGFLGGMVAARASKGSTIIEPAIGAVLLLASFIGVGLAVSGKDVSVVVLPGTMKAIGLTALASAGGGIGGAFMTEKMFGDENASGASWVLFVALAAVGAGIIGTLFGGVLAKGDAGNTIFGLIAVCTLFIGIATGASATSRPLGASFLGGAIGVGGFFFLAIYLLLSMFSDKSHGAGDIPSVVYAGIAVVAVGAGIVTLIGALFGWAIVGSKQNA
ncbi:MAG TPA: hypothetical protein VFV99_18980 [Kofleriaceae bacterium]|nr:hypothetical protein [Kofleriaceae bacterium]